MQGVSCKEGDLMVVNNRFYNNVNKIAGVQSVPSLQKQEQTNGEFGKILSQNIEKSSGLKFSKHAEMRLESRKIQLSDAQKDKINKAVNRAEEKGVKDSLILLDNIALVVNIKNKTVITAVNSNELKDNVFTNIDGAVFA